MYTKASIKNEAKYNLGMLLLKDKEYSKAIPYLKAMPNVNLAYAQLMANDNRAALETLKITRGGMRSSTVRSVARISARHPG